ncbi:MAG: hypothetical protein AB8V06_08500 [Francisella endosymbiont of Hyalomma asiaticum]
MIVYSRWRAARFEKLFNNYLKDSLFTIEQFELGIPLPNSSNTSSNEIRIYNGIKSRFCMKPFEPSSKGYQKNIDNGIAEVVYA